MKGNREEFQEQREVLALEVEKEYFEFHREVFLNEAVKVKASRVIGEDFKNDETHGKLLKSYYNARKELRDYEYNKRFNFKNK